jgi:uroporphyrinogen-III decarboxylase
LSRIEQAVRLEKVDRLPIAPVITAKRDAFEKLVSVNRDLIRNFDGFLLHPMVFDSGYIYIPSKPSLPEPIPVIGSPDGYDEVSDLGPVDYAFKVHEERGLVVDLRERIKESSEAVRKFAERWDKEGVASYCGVMGVTPMGFLSYYRGLNEVLKDMGRDSNRFLRVSMDIAERYPVFLAEIAKEAKVQRACISFAYSSQNTVGKYYFERYIWPPAKTMIKSLISRGITPILQFDDPIADYKFLKELPPRTSMIHIGRETELIKAVENLKNFMCVVGNFQIPLREEEESMKVLERIKAEDLVTGLVLSTEGDSPFILATGNIGHLRRFVSIISRK